MNLDEYGTRWLVLNKDPAYKLVQSLTKKGYQLVVLPRETYKTGIIVEATSDDIIRNIRMKDCIHCLK